MKKIIILTLIFLLSSILSYLLMKDGKVDKKVSPETVVNEKTELNTVVIKDYKFSPSPLRVKKGTKVIWENADIAKHNVVMDDKDIGGPNSQLMGQNDTYTYTFTESGTYNYHCDPHPYMKGVVEVTR